MKAIGKNIIVKRQEKDTATRGGIIYTDTSLVTLARVIAIGDEVRGVNIGDDLVINWHTANLVKLSHDEYHIVNIDHVFAVV